MKKKIGIALALLLALAMTLSVTAHATEPSQAIAGSGDGGTAISITDITPREGENKEDSEDETKGYTVGSHYPVSVQTAEEGGVRLLVKAFLVPPDTDPQTLVEGDLTRQGVAYEATDILRQEQPGEVEKKTVSQTMTLESETDKMENILPLLKSTMDYQADGFSGTLILDRDSIQTKETGTSNYSYQLKETKEYTGLDRNDPYYIPKTTEKNGVTLKLADVKWTPMASGAENSEVPSLFQATALYTGTAWGSKTDGYTVTAEYTGEVSRMTQGEMAYSIVYEAVQPESGAFPWGTVGLAVLGVVLLAAGGFGIFWIIATRPRKKRHPANSPAKGTPDASGKRMEAAL